MNLRFESPEDGMDASFIAPATKDGKSQLKALRDWFKTAGCITLVTKMTQGKEKFFCLVVKFAETESDEEDEFEDSDKEEDQSK